MRSFATRYADDVARLATAGLQGKQIAAQLGIARSTVSRLLRRRRCSGCGTPVTRAETCQSCAQHRHVARLARANGSIEVLIERQVADDRNTRAKYDLSLDTAFGLALAHQVKTAAAEEWLEELFERIDAEREVDRIARDYRQRRAA